MEVSIAMEPEDRDRISQASSITNQQSTDRVLTETMRPRVQSAQPERQTLPVILERRNLSSDSDSDIRLLVDRFFGDEILAKNREGNTALHVLARRGSLGQVEVLVERVKRAWSVGEENWMLRMKNNDRNTPLHEAVLSRNCNVVGYLLDEDLEPLFWQNKQGKSALYLAVEMGELKILDRLLRISLYPHEFALKVEGKSPVHAAVVYGRLGMLEAMAEEKRPLFEIESMADYTALHLAALMDFVPAVKLLLREFPWFALRFDDRGYLPIHVACKEGRIRAIRELLNSFENPLDLLNEEGQNIIHVAAKYGRSSVVKNLLRDHRLERLINQRDNNGNTALHLAAAYWQPKTLHVLTWDSRVDVRLTNDKCQTAYDVACMQDTTRDFVWLLLGALLDAGALGSRDLLLHPHDSGELYPRIKFSRPPSLVQMKDKVGTQLIVAALIATVTFAAGFTMPGGFDGSETQNKGLATLINRSMFQAFVICDTVATYSSIIVVVLLLWTQGNNDPYAFNVAHLLSVIPLYTALLAMSGAFMTGTYSVLWKLPWLRNVVLVMGIIFITAIFSFSAVLMIPIVGRSRWRLIRLYNHYILLGLIVVSGSNPRSPVLKKEEEERCLSRSSRAERESKIADLTPE